ncbi:hypothetical protein BH10ACI4_BH10ACI4_34130 [soil metagenome]
MPFQFIQSRAATAPTLEIPALGLSLAVLLPPDSSDSALTIIETTNAPGFGPPLHRHPETEVFRVLEGRYLYEVDGRSFEVEAGELVTVPGGAIHTFLNITDKPARQLVMLLPGMDAYRFFSELGEVMAHGHPTHEVMEAFGKPWGVEFLGPPLSLITLPKS